MKEKVLISACLLGKHCRYNGRHSHQKELDRFDVDWIPVCPEEAGNLGTPRPVAEMQASAEDILNGRGSIITNSGRDVTKKIIDGAKKSLIKGISSGVEYAILKSRSPSCGNGKVYDGTFSHSLKDGKGIFAHLCSRSGIKCLSSDEPNKIKKTLKKLK